MSETTQFDGPRLIRRAELAGSRRLDMLAFTGRCDESEAETAAAVAGQDVPHGNERLHVICAPVGPVSQIYTFHERLLLPGGEVRIGSIGGVGTHPAYRGYGLASRLLEHTARFLAEGGASVLLISGMRGLYRRAGAEPVGHFYSYTAQAGGSPSPRSLPDRLMGLTMRPAVLADAAAFARLHAAEAVHLARSYELSREFLSHRPHGDWNSRWMIEQDGRPVAYFLLNWPWEDFNDDDAGERFVSEYAGSRLALAWGFLETLHHPPVQKLYCNIAWQDIDLRMAMESAGLRAEPYILVDHTARILRFPALMAGLRGYVRARLEPILRRGLTFEQHGPLLGEAGGDVLTIARGEDRLALNGADMTRLVLGNAGETPPPLPGALAEIIPALFPLPAFMPGMNYH